MSTLTFDTLKFANRLKAVGVPEKQAEEQAAMMAEAVWDIQTNANPATKHDMADLRKEIELVRADLIAKMAETRADLVKWVVSVGVLQTAMIGALLLKLIPG